MKKLAAALLLLATWPCRGQQGTTGELTGIVTSAGRSLPGVTVTLTSNALQSNRITTTGENGGYLFTLVPPADYVVRFDLQGFAPAETRVRVALAEVARADIALTAAPFREELVVTSKGARTDTTIETNLDAPVLRKLPGPRDIRAATQLSSETNALGPRNALIIAGAPSWDSLYLIDGVNASEYLTGQAHNVVLEDAIQEVVVLTGAISAEYGRFTGGVVSTLTKSGGNEFTGSLRDTLTNPKWTLRTPWPGQIRATGNTNHGIEATLGGFVVRDRLWFFGGFRNAESTQDLFTTRTNIAYSSPSRDRRWEGKLNGEVTPRHELVLSYADAMLEEKNVLDTRTGGSVLDLNSLIADRLQPARLLAATYNGMFAKNAAAEVQFSQKRYALRGNGGLTADLILGTPIATNIGKLNAPTGCGICGDDERDSKSLQAKTLLYRNTRWGNHTAILGGEAFQETRTNAATRSASEFSVQVTQATVVGQTAYPVFTPLTRIFLTQHYPGDRGSHLDTSSAYVNDRWDISGRATINAGFRFDQNNAHDAVGRLISDDTAWNPRLSAMVDLARDGRHQLLASFGRYTTKILEGGGTAQQVGTFTQYGWAYNGPPINPRGTPADRLLTPAQALSQLFAWFASQAGKNDVVDLTNITTPDTTTVFHGSLQSPSVDERSVGYAFHSRHGFVRASLIARDWHHFYAGRVDSTTGQQNVAGQTIDIAWVINDNTETKRRYRGVELQGAWDAGNLRAGGGYTWSKLQGNDDEEDGTAFSAPRNDPLALWYPELVGYPQRRPYGYLRQDERNRVRAWVSYDWKSLTAMLVQRFDSGHPYSATLTVDAGKILPHGGYSTSQLFPAPYYIGGRGIFRTDDVYSTDVAIQYQLPLGRGTHFFGKLDVLNTLNRHAVVAPASDVQTRLAFNPFTDVPVAGENYALSPSFGKPTGPDSYQTPRTFEIAFGARF